MAKTRIDVYVETKNIIFLEQMREEWNRKNYSQVINHLIGSYVNLLKELKTDNFAKKHQQKEQIKKDPLTELEKKYGIIQKYGDE